MVGAHLLSAHSLSPFFPPPCAGAVWRTSTALGANWAPSTWAAPGLLADIPVETDMLLSLIQSLVVDPENERLVRKMSHKPAISGSQQVSLGGLPTPSGSFPDSFPLSYQFPRLGFLSHHWAHFAQFVCIGFHPRFF